MDTKDEKATEECSPRVRDQPILCVKGCGFYGQKTQSNMCSSCFKKHNITVIKAEEDEAKV